MTLNLWDCGGQDIFVENYFSSQRDHIFRMVEVLIHVFDVESKEVAKDIETFVRCLQYLREYSPDAKVFVLLHKMDLVQADRKELVFNSTMKTLDDHSQSFGYALQGFATSIWDESLYKAWSSIVCSLIPNMSLFQKHLFSFADISDAQEVVLFEKTTFLVVSHVSPSTNSGKNLDPKRFEKISNIIKTYKQSCGKMRSQFQSISLQGNNCCAYIDSLTANTFIMVVMPLNDSNNSKYITGDIDGNTIITNMRAARDWFEKIEQDNI
jgi:Ras-related GTP-binding protein A/B